MKRLALCSLLALPALSHALDVPKAGIFDKRVKYVDYNPANVVKLVAHFGYQIDIVLAEGEHVVPKGVYMGDSTAWQFGTLQNHIFVKPREEGGETNMTVLTNLRTYSFDLSSHESQQGSNSNDMYYQVNFRYPQDEAARLAAAKQAEAVRKKLDEKPAPRNWNYWVQGSDSLAPDAAYDDGRFTYLTFKGNREIPAVFIVNEDGSESLINRHVEGDNVIIQATARKFVLRKGRAVACVFNESFDPVGTGNETGATVPGVVRVVKGEE